MIRVAVAILRQSGKVIVCQRKNGGRYALKWEFPGGKLEPGETILGCLERELQEELSITVTDVDRVESTVVHYNDGGYFELSYCHVRAFDGDLRNNVFEQIRWVSPEELATMDVLEGNTDIIKRLARP